MSDIVKVTLCLGGRLAGKNAKLNGYFFEKGRLTIEGGRDQVESLSKYFERSYQAYPEGHPRLAELAEACAAADKVAAAEREVPSGEPDLQESAEPGQAATPAAGEVQPDGGGTPEVPGDDGAGATGDPGGSESDVPDGDGHTDPRLPVEEEEPEHARHRGAVAALNPEDDTHWTEDGLPAIEAVAELLGDGSATRETIEGVAAGFTREHALVPVEEDAEQTQE